MSDFVSIGQFRLEDGTFCRPEPFMMSVWADDLFMSVPFLVRLGKLTGEKKYFDDVITNCDIYYCVVIQKINLNNERPLKSNHSRLCLSLNKPAKGSNRQNSLRK